MTNKKNSSIVININFNITEVLKKMLNYKFAISVIIIFLTILSPIVFAIKEFDILLFKEKDLFTNIFFIACLSILYVIIIWSSLDLTIKTKEYLYNLENKNKNSFEWNEVAVDKWKYKSALLLSIGIVNILSFSLCYIFDLKFYWFIIILFSISILIRLRSYIELKYYKNKYNKFKKQDG